MGRDFSIGELEEELDREFPELPENKWRVYEKMKNYCRINDSFLINEEYDRRMGNILVVMNKLYD